MQSGTHGGMRNGVESEGTETGGLESDRKVKSNFGFLRVSGE